MDDTHAVKSKLNSETSKVALRCLIVEDNPADADLMVMHLTQEGYDVDWLRVENETDFLAALINPFDLILSDWSMPQFSGLKALQLLQQHHLEIPFLIVSGGIGEETAVALMHQGAADYIWKDRIGRLGQAVKNALAQYDLKIANIETTRALEASEAELRGLFSAMQDVVLVIDRDGVYQKIAPTNPGLLIKPAKDLLGHCLQDFFTADQTDHFIRVIRNVLENQKLQFVEYALSIEDQVIWFQASLSPISSQEIIWVARDITARKQAEESLRQSEKCLRSVLENSPDTIYLYDLTKKNVIFLNREAFCGYTVDEFKNPGFILKSVHPEDLAEVIKNWESLTTTGLSIPIEYRLQGKQGDWVWIQQRIAIVNRHPDQTPQQIIVTLTDITARKQAEKAVLQSEERFRLLIENASDVFYQVGLTDDPCRGKVEFVSPQALELTGYPNENFILNRELWINSVHPDDLPLLYETTQQLITNLVPVMRDYRLWNISKKEYRWVSDRVTPRLDPSGKLIGYQGVARDVTERKMMEEVLRESERRYQLISSAASDYMFSTHIGANGKLELVWTGGAFEAITGYSMQEYIARGGWRAALHPDDLEKDDRDMDTLRSNQKVITEIRTVKKDGSVVWVKVYANPVLDPERQELIGIYGAVQDITERKRAEEENTKRLADLEIVNRISTSLREAQTLDELLSRFLDDTLNIFQTDTAGIWLFDPNVGELRNAISCGWLSTEKTSSQAETIAHQVFNAGTTIVSNKTAQDISLWEFGDLIPTNFNALCVPLHAENETIGVLYIMAEHAGQLTNENIRLLTIVCEIAGNAIRRVQLFQRTQQQLERLSVLHNIDQAISSTRELDRLLNQLLHHITDQLKVDAADILLIDSKNHILKYRAGLGFRSSTVSNISSSVEDGHVGIAALKERQVIGLSNNKYPSTGPCVRIQQIPEEEFIAHFTAPLVVKEEVIGALEVFHRASLTPDKEWLDYYETLAGQVAIAIENASLFEGLQRSNAELIKAYDATILGWSQAMDLRDKETEDHTRRVTEITLRLARRLGIAEDQLRYIWRGALLHDIGKLGVPDRILLKKDILDDDEWAVMRKHPRLAYDMLSQIDYLLPALDIPYCHHEKWDGTGYPRGLKAEEIPLSARIFALADVYDALTSDRPYRKAWPRKKALLYIGEQAGKHFDPKIVDAFLSLFQTNEFN
jgi:PAS domain S-box-containing protein